MDRRDDLRQPIRLRATFKSVRSLISEYTTSVSKGGCTLPSKKPLEPGQIFILELATEGQSRKSLEIEGRVVHSTERKGGGFDIGIQYVAVSTPRRVAMTRFLDQVFAEQLAARSHARVPVNLVAQDADDPSFHYLIRDLSRGGMGLRLAVERPLPSTLRQGASVGIVIKHDGETPFELKATIARLEAGAGPKRQPTIGLRFEPLNDANQRVVDALLYLHRPRLVLLRFQKS